MVKNDYQKPECVICTFETMDVVTLSISDGATFDAQDYGWWNFDNFTGGIEK